MTPTIPSSFHFSLKRYSLGISIFIILAYLVCSSSILAQPVETTQSVEVSPPSQEITVHLGQTATITALARNISQQSIPIQVRIENFAAAGEDGQVALVTDPHGITAWTTISPATFTLAPGESKEVTATIRIPEKGIVGGQYASFIFSTANTTRQENTASVAQEVASLFLVRIAGTADERLSLRSLTAPQFSETGTIPFMLTFQNNGNVHVKPYGLIHITDMFGQRVTDIIVPGENVLPGSIRSIRTKLNKTFLVGKYKAIAVFYYGINNTQTLTAETSFIVIPYKILILLGISLFLFYKMRKRLRKSIQALVGK